MKKKVKWKYFIPSILIMLIIFCFSAQPAVQSSALSGGIVERIVDFINKTTGILIMDERTIGGLTYAIRKFAHGFEYSLLAASFMYAIYKQAVSYRFLITVTGVLCFLYACSDEFHQSFIPGRSPQISDVMIDSAGAALGIAVSLLFIHWIKRRRKVKENEA